MNEEVVKLWLRKADADLKIGKDEMRTDDPVTDMVCFHMQQCCEKYLKAFLIFNGREYPKVHNIELLIKLCADVDKDFEQLRDWGAGELTDYATTLRYREEFYEPSVEETERAIALAERVRNFVREKMKKAGFNADR